MSTESYLILFGFGVVLVGYGLYSIERLLERKARENQRYRAAQTEALCLKLERIHSTAWEIKARLAGIHEAVVASINKTDGR